MQSREGKPDRVERLLRAQGPCEFSPDFTRRVMEAVSHLPDPALVAPPRGIWAALCTLRLFSPGERLIIGLILACVVALLLPGVDAVLEALRWELTGVDLSLTVGGTALSASLFSVVAVCLGIAFMAFVGAYVSRNHLIAT